VTIKILLDLSTYLFLVKE